MPTVPGSIDPFKTRIAGKDQSRVPHNVVPMFKPSETEIAIAAATMHGMGRLLFDPTPVSQDKPFGDLPKAPKEEPARGPTMLAEAQ